MMAASRTLVGAILGVTSDRLTLGAELCLDLRMGEGLADVLSRA